LTSFSISEFLLAERFGFGLTPLCVFLSNLPFEKTIFKNLRELINIETGNKAINLMESGKWKMSVKP